MPAGPRMVRRRLGRRLLQLREASGISERDAATATGISRAKLWRMETGKVPIAKADVWALCRVYRVDDSAADALAAMCEGTRTRGWWDGYTDIIPDWFQLYGELESEVAQICCYEGESVPGELQTADYARAWYQALCPTDPPDTINRRVEMRLKRHKNLHHREPPPQLSVVLGENVLRRAIGGPAVLRKQVQHLRKLATLDNVDIRILPWKVGGHIALSGAFRLLDFADPEDPPIVYLQTMAAGHYLEDPGEVDNYRRAWKSLAAQAIPLVDRTT